MINHQILKLARRAARLTQVELAARVGVDPALISRLEKGGRVRPGYETIVRIARALNLPPDELFPVTEAPRGTKGTRHAGLRVTADEKEASR